MEMRDELVFEFLDVIPMPVLVSEQVGDRQCDNRPRFVNAAFLEQIGYGLDEIPDIDHWFHLAYPDPSVRETTRSEWFGAVESSLERGRRTAEASALIQQKDGRQRWFLITAQVRCDSLPGMHIVTFKDVHDLKALSDENHYLSRTDQLTLAFNRRAGQRLLETELARFERGGAAFSVVMCDVDHFKSINDRSGHPCGDQMLVRVAQLLRSHCRDIDAVVRWGGDEFLLILPGTPLGGAAVVAEKIRQSVQALRCVCEGAAVSTSLSLGCACSLPGQTVAELLKAADMALYSAKHRGRNAVGA